MESLFLTPVCLYKRYLLDAFSILGTILEAGDKTMKKKTPGPKGFCSLVGDISPGKSKEFLENYHSCKFDARGNLKF